MRPSRGMGCINPKKVPGGKGSKGVRKDAPEIVLAFEKGGHIKQLVKDKQYRKEK